MGTRSRENAPIFGGIFWLVLAWRIADAGGGDWFVLFIAGWMALGGTIMLIGSFNRLQETRGPRPLTRVPPLWLMAWVAVLVCAFTVGTPHLRVGRDGVRCSYVGWNGLVQLFKGSCSVVEFIPLPGADNPSHGK